MSKDTLLPDTMNDHKLFVFPPFIACSEMEHRYCEPETQRAEKKTCVRGVIVLGASRFLFLFVLFGMSLFRARTLSRGTDKATKCACFKIKEKDQRGFVSYIVRHYPLLLYKFV